MNWIKKNPKVEPSKNDDIVDKIAKIRGIEDVDRFLNPSEDELHSPYFMKNIEDAANRIITAIHNDEKIIVSYDPDADGITSTTVMLKYLKNYTENVDFIYGERNDGHGIFEMITVKDLDPIEEEERRMHNMKNTDKIHDADLLILIDSSSNDSKACKFIKEKLKTDIIVIDHHEIEEDNPHVLMVNPQQEDCTYPNKQLSGAGVVFKVMEVMEDTLDNVDIWQYIDLVAVGMYADMMRLDVMENRYLIAHGLRNIRNVGLLRILKGANVNTFKGINGDAVGFSIAPLINGVARLGQLKLAIDILMEDDDKVCMKLRLQMSKLNKERASTQKEITERYVKDIDDSKKVIIVSDENSNKGFNGLVAQQISNKFGRPSMIGRIANGKFSGSFRSYNNFNFKKFLSDCDKIQEAKGHAGAGGFSINMEDMPVLLEYIEENMESPKDREPTIYYDYEVTAKEVPDHVEAIEMFNHISGTGFPKITVKVEDIMVSETECIGATKETIKITTMDGIQLMKFKVSEDYASDIEFYDEIEAVGKVGMNKFYHNGLKKVIETVQVIIDDYQKV